MDITVWVFLATVEKILHTNLNETKSNFVNLTLVS